MLLTILKMMDVAWVQLVMDPTLIMMDVAGSSWSWVNRMKKRNAFMHAEACSGVKDTVLDRS